MKLNYLPPEDSNAIWGNKQAVIKRYEGLNVYTLNRMLKEMRNNKSFKDGVINPTHKLVFINFESFESFLYWRQHHYYK